MTTRRRSILLSLGLVTAATVSLAATVDYWWNHLPNPSAADRDELFWWLIHHDLRQEPLETRSALLRRLSEELDQGIDFALVDEQLGSSERQRFLDNAEVMLEDWFHAFAQTYRDTQPAEQPARIDHEIERVRRWGLLEYLAGKNSKPDQKGNTEERVATPWKAIQDFNTRALAWIEHAEPVRKAELRTLLSAIRTRIFAQALESFQR